MLVLIHCSNCHFQTEMIKICTEDRERKDEIYKNKYFYINIEMGRPRKTFFLRHEKGVQFETRLPKTDSCQQTKKHLKANISSKVKAESMSVNRWLTEDASNMPT